MEIINGIQFYHPNHYSQEEVLHVEDGVVEDVGVVQQLHAADQPQPRQPERQHRRAQQTPALHVEIVAVHVNLGVDK